MSEQCPVQKLRADALAGLGRGRTDSVVKGEGGWCFEGGGLG